MEEYKYSGNYDDPVLAELYDLTETEQDDVTLLRKLIGDSGPLRILECFSGTGRILVPLLQDGHMVTGIELAPAMRARAWTKIARLDADIRSRARLRVVDALDGDWGVGYDLVIMGGNAFYELPSAELQERCVQFAQRALKPGGYLFIDNNDYKGDWGGGPFGKERVVFEGTVSDGTFARYTMKAIRFDEERQVLYVERTTYKRTPDGHEVVHKYIGKKHPVTMEEVRTWLLRHGFEVVKLFGDRQGMPYTPGSERAIFWAKRKAT